MLARCVSCLIRISDIIVLHSLPADVLWGSFDKRTPKDVCGAAKFCSDYLKDVLEFSFSTESGICTFSVSPTVGIWTYELTPPGCV